jgi:hypothetical protein
MKLSNIREKGKPTSSFGRALRAATIRRRRAENQESTQTPQRGTQKDRKENLNR